MLLHVLFERRVRESFDEFARPVHVGTVKPARPGLEDQRVIETLEDCRATVWLTTLLLRQFDEIRDACIVRYTRGVSE